MASGFFVEWLDFISGTARKKVVSIFQSSEDRRV